MSANTNIAVTAVVYILLVTKPAHAQNTLDAQRQALDLITNTADRICNVVTTKGETQSTEVQGTIQAALGGLASRLTNAGISGSSKITNSRYQNVLQNDLSATLRDNAACKLKVFDALQRTILGTQSGQMGGSQQQRRQAAPQNQSFRNMIVVFRGSMTQKAADISNEFNVRLAYKRYSDTLRVAGPCQIEFWWGSIRGLLNGTVAEDGRFQALGSITIPDQSHIHPDAKGGTWPVRMEGVVTNEQMHGRYFAGEPLWSQSVDFAYEFLLQRS